jgi:hypothetical protein
MEKDNVELLTTDYNMPVVLDKLNSNYQKKNEKIVDFFDSLGIKNYYLKKNESVSNSDEKIEIPNFHNFKTNFLDNHTKRTQSWVGFITKIQENSQSFEAKIYDIYDRSTYEIQTFYFNEISDEDKEFILEGGVFYWSVGQNVRNSQVFTESSIRFQRLPQLTVEEVDEAIDEANELIKFFV